MSHSLILLGASEFSSTSFQSSAGFANAKEALRGYFCSKAGFGVADEFVLDLFDSKLSQIDQLSEIQKFFSRLGQENTSFSGNTYNFVCYVGHGFLDAKQPGLFLATKLSGGVDKYAEAIHSDRLFDTIRKVAADRNTVALLDCCFAASAFANTMSDDQIEQALSDAAEGLPAAGGILIGSSGAEERSYLLEDGTCTVFSQCFSDILVDDTPNLRREFLSGRILVEQIRTAAHRRLGTFAPTPHIFDMDQSAGSISIIDLFPVLARNSDRTTITSDNNEASALMSSSKVSAEEELEVFKFVEEIRGLVPNIRHCLIQSQLEDSAYLTSVRLKKTDRIISKISDRRSGKDPDPDYCLGSVTDIIGLRLIALYRSDVERLLEKVMKLLTGVSRMNPNSLRAITVNEIIIYSTKPEEAAENQLLKALVEGELADARSEPDCLNQDLDVIVRGRKDYSSVHIVVELGRPSGVGAVPIEIQVRSILEDVWATIDYDLRYSRDRRKNPVGTTPSSKSNPYLQNLKSFFDASSDYTDLIKFEIDAQSRGKPNAMEPIDGATDFSDVAEELGIDRRIRGRLSSFLLEKETIDQRRKAFLSNGPNENAETELANIYAQYKNLADQLKEFGDQSISENGLLGADYQASDAKLFAYYSFRMEEAYCRASVISAPSQLLAARRIYELLSEEISSNPVVFLRLGESFAKMSQWDEAIRAYAQAHKLYEELKSKTVEERGWHFTDKQVEYFSSHLPRLYGYAYWAKSQILELSSDERAKFLGSALEITITGFERVRAGSDRTRYLNNIVYYWTQLSELNPDHLALKRWDSAKMGQHFLELVEAARGSGIDAFKIKDTVVKYGSGFGCEEEALELSHELFGLCMQPDAVAVYGEGARERSLKSVQELWAKQRPKKD